MHITRYMIYKINHHVAGSTMSYIGLTSRDIRERLLAHFYEASRLQKRGISKYSLGYAIREHKRRNPTVPLESAFSIEVLERNLTKEAVGLEEARLIRLHKTLFPIGYNIMKGGESLGGPSNSSSCEVLIDGVLNQFGSFTAAANSVAERNGIKNTRQFLGRAKARMHTGWSLRQALSLEPRADGRRTELSVYAHNSGISLATLRSQKFRDSLKSNRAPQARPVQLPNPYNPCQRVSQRKAFQLLGISQATGRHRLQQIDSKFSSMTPEEILKHISTPQDRTKRLSFVLPDGSRIIGGINELARKYSRPGLGFSAIKRRLREVEGSPANHELLAAIGLIPRRAKNPLVR